MLNSISTIGYHVVKNVLSSELCELLDSQYEMYKNKVYTENSIPEQNTTAFGDPQVEKSFSVYSPIFFEPLLIKFLPTMENIVGKNLHPSYCYSRIYYNGAKMEPHCDRPSCEYSATLCISIDPKPWEIWFEDLNKTKVPLILNVGDMCVYQGTKLTHWRNEYNGNRQTQVFLHYVEKDGQYAEYAYDNRKSLGLKFSPLQRG